MPSDFVARILAFIASLAMAIFFGAWFMHKYDKAKFIELNTKFSAFRTEIDLKGRNAQIASEKQALFNLRNKERTDEEVSRRTAAFISIIAQLRGERDRHRSDFLSAATALAGSSARADQYRAEFVRAYGRLISEIRGLGDEGSKAVLGLDAAKIWARDLSVANDPHLTVVEPPLKLKSLTRLELMEPALNGL